MILDAHRRKAIQIKALCTLLVKLADQDINQRIKEANIDMNVSSLIVLHVLHAGPLTVQKLSERIIVAAATLVPIIDDLEAGGFLTRQVNPNDRREKKIAVTPAGTQILRKIARANLDNKIITSVSRQKQADLDRAIHVMEDLVCDMSGDDTTVKIIRDRAGKFASEQTKHANAKTTAQTNAKNTTQSRKVSRR